MFKGQTLGASSRNLNGVGEISARLGKMGKPNSFGVSQKVKVKELLE